MSEPDNKLDHVIAAAFGLYESNRNNFLIILKLGIEHNIAGSYTKGELGSVAAHVNDIIESGKIDGLGNNPRRKITGPKCLERLQEIEKSPDPTFKYATVPENASELYK
ncbi:hypothetical protein HYALB_00001742 [Hymenoscyphus albidus]|uniref:Uncharacterized protein n=1 Tax=Hymenoscyphus albidus TaxID=595503 RepID=A0A9N9Q333_9HELO|nr:hypothetical protein HYALB_00001742 [Hymenoscyphus albidus]